MFALDCLVSRGHKKISFYHDPQARLVSIIAIHDTTLGPALGGCRIKNYRSLESALEDVLNLSEAMTYKNALCGINFGGGKSVILADSALKEGRAELYQSFAKCVSSLNGQYITAKDVGTTLEDLSIVKRVCGLVAGTNTKLGGGGDPSPYTAIGIVAGMRACLERVYGSVDFAGKIIAIQGVGNVGYSLAKLLAAEGCKLLVYDSDEKKITRVIAETKAQAVKASEIFGVKCDIFAPCALGGVINPNSVAQLKSRIVAGGANNQLSGDNIEKELTNRGILYAPDFAINAGGVILCADECEVGGFSEKRVLARVGEIYHTVGKIIDQSKRTGKLAGEIAVSLAKERIENCKAEKRKNISSPI